jgi:hypothetical protein
MTRALAPRFLVLCAIVLTAGLVRVSAQTPARDAGRPNPTGTASLSGIVVTDDADARPIRRARIAIFTSDRQVGRTDITDDSGAYSFTALPAGRYLSPAPNKDSSRPHAERHGPTALARR